MRLVLLLAVALCSTACVSTSMKNAQSADGRDWNTGGELRFLGIPISLKHTKECAGLERARFTSIGLDPILAYRVVESQCVGE